MKTSGVRKGVLVYTGPGPVGKMEIPVNAAYNQHLSVLPVIMT